MKSFDNTAKILTKDKHLSSVDLAQPKVYFRGINRVHINRFKAYNHIISNRLNAIWLITDDLMSANVVVDLVQLKNQHKKVMKMSVLAGTANLKPSVLMAFKLVFDDKRMVQQLNQASRKLSQTNHSGKQSIAPGKVIKVCGLLNESLNLLCDSLNQKSQGARFVPSVGVISNQNVLYRDQLLLIVDGQDKESVLAYEIFIAKKLNASIIIDQLTIAIIKSKDEAVNEKMFDLVYGYSDDHTQVTLLNIEDENELDVFATYF